MSAASREIETTCPYCGVGCGVSAAVEATGKTGPRLLPVNGSSEHPANLGRLCVKGSALHETMGEEGRLLYPKIHGCRTEWNTALDVVAAGFTDVIRRHGPQAVAFYLSGQLLTEDYYVANKLMKGFIGSANVDTNSRLCMASAVSAYKRAFGADAVPCCYEDLEQCDLLVMVGSNAAWTHPVLYQRISAAKAARPGMKVVVIDPRRTATCDIADLHLPIAPGSDAHVFTGLLGYLGQHDHLDCEYIDNHTEGFEAALAEAEELSSVVAATGLARADLLQFYQWFASHPRCVTFYSQGINQSATGTDKCNAIINCHLATGRLGKPGMGPFSITGQPNAMGGREVGGLANQLAAHMDFSPDNVARVGRFWQAPNMASKPGLKAVEMFEAMERGEIKAVWIMATNPVVSLPDAERFRRALKQCDLVVVSDCVEKTDTTACAHVLLPAQGWAEKDGTVTNSERCISRQRALLPAPGEARPDWWIISQVAERMGHGKYFQYSGPAAIFREHATLSGIENGTGGAPVRAFNIGALAAIKDAEYDSLEPIRWPLPAGRIVEAGGPRRLFADGKFFTPSGRAAFVAVQARLPVGRTSLRAIQGRQAGTGPRNLDMVLNSGRIRDQWHTMTRTGRSARLLRHIEAPFVAINPLDAARTGTEEGGLLRLTAGQSSILLQARIDPGQQEGEIFAPIHWNDQNSSHGRIGVLFPAVTDPVSGQPQSKFTTVKVSSQQVGCWAQVVSREALDLRGIDYWVSVAVPGGGWRYLLALLVRNDESPPTTMDRLAQWSAMQAEGEQRIAFSHGGRKQYRALFTSGDAIKLAVFAAEKRQDLSASAFIESLLIHEVSADSWKLLQASADDGSGERIICSCHQVSESRIVAAIKNGAASHEALGKALGCGTKCGSCIPELKQTIGNVLSKTTEADLDPALSVSHSA